MSSVNGDKLNRVEELKSKLFNRNYQTKFEHRDSFPHFQKREVTDSWKKKEDPTIDSKEKFLMKTSMFKKFFIFSLIFFALALGYASYVFFAENNTVSNDNIDISVKSNAFADGGEEYSLLLEVVNRNSTALDLVDLVVEYPKNSQVSLSENNEHIRMSLGSIPIGGVKNENLKLVLFGEQGSRRQIKISIEYRVEGSNAIFVKEKFFEVSINSTPIDLLINAPFETSSDKDINFNVKATLNATKPASKILLKVDYPIGFQFVRATPAPTLGDNIWNLGDLSPGAEYSVSIVGKMVDVFDGEEKVFRVWTGSQSERDRSLIGTFFNSSEHTLMIKKSSIEAKLSINGVSDREYAIDSKTGIQGQIQWINNLEAKINNLEISAKISGNAVDRKTISTNQGFYNSSEDLIIWNKNSHSEFREISPGDSGAVSFSLYSRPLFEALGGVTSSPTINIDISVTGEQAQGGGEKVELSNKESKIIKIISDVGLSTKAFYSSGSFTNTGPIPPKAEQKTTYTVVWSISNTANNISKAEVRSSVPPWVRLLGPFIPATEDFVYNASTREIVWNIGGIPRGTGITGGEREIFFQIELTPSLSQVGTSPVIVNEAILTGHDDFVNVDVKVKKPPIDIKLPSDPNIPADGVRVVE